MAAMHDCNDLFNYRARGWDDAEIESIALHKGEERGDDKSNGFDSDQDVKIQIHLPSDGMTW